MLILAADTSLPLLSVALLRDGALVGGITMEGHTSRNEKLLPALDWLLTELAKTEHPTACPHGRPIALRYSHKDIAKAFQRI